MSISMVLLMGAAIVALLLWAIWTIGARSQQPRKRPNENKPDRQFESVTFESNGSTLHGWLIHPHAEGIGSGGSGHKGPNGESDMEKQPIVVIAHGWGSNRSRVLRYSKPLLDAGFSLFMYDARSHGDSDSIAAPSALMFRDDAVAAVAAVRKITTVDPERIAILGHSLGGFGALLALGDGLPVKAVVTDSMPTRFETMLKAELKRHKLPYFPLGLFIPPIWLYRAGITRSEYAKAQIPVALDRNDQGAKIPVFMVHANGDGFIPADDLRKLGMERKISSLFVEGDGHSSSETDPVFWQQVIPFLKEHLQVTDK
ncbi:alpha/beta hydrolase [Paenibacillus mendelii]|uniref:Alpha/beta hydrolase n=1 Tax=Paenibacillus mendelii TaxID=206163 RepID=A0ABV6J8K2_9BACL|nr:alpha/beta fold hydrolase [Paenibacillus mendelii]MCQ6559553.1 alpha/beta fold hydrolase [Paenibacillus mendelii]